MIRAALFGLLSLALVTLSAPAGQDPPDEPPPVLKKKVRPAQPPEDKDKPAPKDESKDKKDPEPKAKTDSGPDPAKEAQEILDRIAKNIKASEERIKAKDVGDGTQQVQRDIVKDLDALIEKENEDNQDPQDPQAGMPGGGKSKQKASSRRSKSSGQPKGQDNQSGQGNNPKNSGQPGKDGGMGGTSPEAVNKLADLYRDVWGHLPEKMRQEMDAYQKEGYMTKYRELLKQYYATIAEKARKQAEGEKR